MRPNVLCLLFLMLLFCPLSAHSTPLSSLISRIAQEERIPPKLLHAIVHLESSTHPWTLNVRGKPYFFNSRQAASTFLTHALSQGITNIDIGLCQLNAFWHGKAVKHPTQFLDPATNLRYSAKLLRRYARKTGSWMKGVAFYHSSLPVYQSVYKKKLKQLLLKGRPS